jgi:hypothetical protein
MATIGSTSAPSTNTIYYDALLSSTVETYVKGGMFFDNIFKDSAFLTFLKNNGAWEEKNGGERIRVGLMYDTNSTIKTHSGYEVIDTTPQEGITSAFYEWAEIAGSISISRKEERQNSGEGQIVELLGEKIKQAEMTMTEKLNTQLVQGTVSSATFVPSQSTAGINGLLPLGYFLRKNNQLNPTTGGNVGNISAVTESWWRHKTAVLDSGSADTGNDFAAAVTTYAGLQANLYRMYNTCGRGSGGSPNLVLMDQHTFEEYNNALDTKTRYVDTKMADMGFDNVKLRGATCLWDEVVPDIDNGTTAITAGTAFFLNTNFYKVYYDKETNIVVTPFVEPENQTAKTAKILFMGQACVSNLRKLGVVYAVSQSIVS